MKIVLINENSQASKNELVFNTLKKVVEPKGHSVFNIGMFGSEDKSLTYVQNGIIAAVLLNSGACDFVITGCGTGSGAMLACNAFPNVNCGLIVDPSDAYMFAQINDGNCASFPFAKGFGWGAELNLEYCFEQLFKGEKGQGYPKERKEPEQRNKKILDVVKTKTFKPLKESLLELDRDLVLGALDRPSFKDYFFKNAKDEDLIKVVTDLLK
jgi:ribose 5-phosphate isomerase RpiB